MIGHSRNPTDIAIVRDKDGEVEVNLSFALSRPDIYISVGRVQINKNIVHYFEYNL